jgi:hypothetical protein
VCLGSSPKHPVDIWAHRNSRSYKSASHVKSVYHVIDKCVQSFATPTPSHALAMLWCNSLSVGNRPHPTNTRTGILSQAGIDAVPLVVAQASAPENCGALVRGLLQLAPADRVTCDAAMGLIFFRTRWRRSYTWPSLTEVPIPLCRACSNRNYSSGCKLMLAG